jgi:hypothetical protein
VAAPEEVKAAENGVAVAASEEAKAVANGAAVATSEAKTEEAK